MKAPLFDAHHRQTTWTHLHSIFLNYSLVTSIVRPHPHLSEIGSTYEVFARPLKCPQYVHIIVAVGLPLTKMKTSTYVLRRPTNTPT